MHKTRKKLSGSRGKIELNKLGHNRYELICFHHSGAVLTKIIDEYEAEQVRMYEEVIEHE